MGLGGSVNGKAGGDLTVRTWDALKGAFWPIFLAIGEKTREAGTTPAQISLLFVLFSSAGTMTPAAVARVLGVTPGTVTGTLNPLEDMDLIERVRGETADRRVVQLRLTPKGRGLLKGWLESSRVIIEERMGPLSVEERRTLTALLARIGPPIPGVPETLASTLRLKPPGRPKASETDAGGAARARSGR